MVHVFILILISLEWFIASNESAVDLGRVPWLMCRAEENRKYNDFHHTIALTACTYMLDGEKVRTNLPTDLFLNLAVIFQQYKIPIVLYSL